MKKMILAPSILAADFCELGKEIRMTEENGAEYLHFDVMDGKFVPSISFGTLILESVRRTTKQIIDVHLMLHEPLERIDSYAKSGADIITVHLEACADMQKVIDKIKENHVKCGISIKPDTPVEALKPYLSQVDMVLIMTVEPGKGGQPFMMSCLDKVKELKAILDRENLDVDIEVDGGIHAGNIQTVVEAGANVIVAGSSVFNGNVVENTQKLMGMLRENEK